MFARFFIALLLSVLLALHGCGYAFQGSGSILPDDVQTVAVRPTENTTTIPGLSLRFAEKLRSRFERYGVVKVVDHGEHADAELVTKIVNLQTRTRDVTSETDIALELELIMIVSAELRRPNGQVLYRNPTLVASEVFASTSDVVVTSSSAFAQAGIGADTLAGLGDREVMRGAGGQALEELMEDVARRIYLDAVAAEF